MSQKVVEVGAIQGDPKKPRKNDMLVQEENQDSHLIAAMKFIIGIHTQKDRSAINALKIKRQYSSDHLREGNVETYS